MAALERQARAPVGFVAASAGPEGGNRPTKGQDSEAVNGNGVKNDAEIDLDDDLWVSFVLWSGQGQVQVLSPASFLV
jgi:hypothetical protein